MEYYLCRAEEIARLSKTQVAELYARELADGLNRCLYPYEIQASFNLPSLKQHWGIPEDDFIAQSAHNSRLRALFTKYHLNPGYDLDLTNIQAVHAFDSVVIKAISEYNFNFSYIGPTRRNRRTDEIGIL